MDMLSGYTEPVNATIAFASEPASLPAAYPELTPAVAPPAADVMTGQNESPTEATATPESSHLSLNGWVKVQNALIADPGLSDRALRLWLALDKWVPRKGWPSNAQLARECGWYILGTDRPAAQKVKDAFADLEARGYLKRVVVGEHRRRAEIEMSRPGDDLKPGAGEPGSYSTQVPKQPGAGSYSNRGLGPIATGAGSYKTHREELGKESQEGQARNSRAPAQDKSPSDPGDAAGIEAAAEQGQLGAGGDGRRENAAAQPQAAQEPAAILEPFEAGPASERASARARRQGPPTKREQLAAAFGGALPGEHEPDLALMESAVALVDRWYAGRADIHEQLRLQSRIYPTAWFVRVLKRVVANGKHGRCGWGLLRSILNEWSDLGAPDPGPEDRFDDQMNPLKPSQRAAIPPAPGKPADNRYGPLSPEAEERARQLHDDTLAQIRAKDARDEEEARNEPARERAVPREAIMVAGRIEKNFYVGRTITRTTDVRIIARYCETHPAVAAALAEGGHDGLGARLTAAREAITADADGEKAPGRTVGRDSITAMVRAKRPGVARAS